MTTINTISDKFEVSYSTIEEEIKGLPIVDGSEDFGDWSSLINAMAVRGGLSGVDSIVAEVIDRLQNELCAVVTY